MHIRIQQCLDCVSEKRRVDGAEDQNCNNKTNCETLNNRQKYRDILFASACLDLRLSVERGGRRKWSGGTRKMSIGPPWDRWIRGPGRVTAASKILGQEQGETYNRATSHFVSSIQRVNKITERPRYPMPTFIHVVFAKQKYYIRKMTSCTYVQVHDVILLVNNCQI